MALDKWPTGLPYRSQQDGFEVQRRFIPPVRTEVEDGPDILRQWSSSNWTKIAWRMLWTHAEYDVFDAFVLTTLNRGRKRFEMPMGRLGQAVWTDKVVFIEPSSIAGPRYAGEGHVMVDFVLNVNGW